MSIVQLFTREPRAYRQFDELNTDLLNANQGAIKAMNRRGKLAMIRQAG